LLQVVVVVEQQQAVVVVLVDTKQRQVFQSVVVLHIQ
jgi:hypothetical protein